MTNINRKDINEAAAIIARGGLVAMPTETVYGLAADATSDAAIARIFEAKQRPQFNPLIVHVADAKMAAQYVIFSAQAKKLADHFWPGPLTIVLPRKKHSAISLLASAGLDTLAVRAPNHQIAQALIKAAGRPLAAPSANRSGTVSPTRADHVAASLGERVNMVLDGGACSIGVESTIVSVVGARVVLLRPGGISREDIERFLGRPVKDAAATDTPLAPGMMASHYAPAALLRLNAATPNNNEAFLGFGVDHGGAHTLNLSANGDLREAAANLFAHLRTLDSLCANHKLDGIAVAPIASTGLGEAINDRLKRAAAPRRTAPQEK